MFSSVSVCALLELTYICTHTFLVFISVTVCALLKLLIALVIILTALLVAVGAFICYMKTRENKVHVHVVSTL